MRAYVQIRKELEPPGHFVPDCRIVADEIRKSAYPVDTGNTTKTTRYIGIIIGVF